MIGFFSYKTGKDHCFFLVNFKYLISCNSLIDYRCNIYPWEFFSLTLSHCYKDKHIRFFFFFFSSKFWVLVSLRQSTSE
jgi:hypothetical protein